MKIFDSTLSKLESALDARLTRQNVLAENLANVDTPNYRERDVDFTAVMSGALAPSPVPLSATGGRTHALHMTLPETSSANLVTTVERNSEGAGMDGNGVDLDRTMVAMAENALQYGASAKAATKKLAILRYVASDGVG